jgi:hypothetical protein
MTISVQVFPQGHYVIVERIEENGERTVLAGPFTGAHHSSLAFNAWKGVSILVTEVEQPEMPQQMIDDNAHLLNPPSDEPELPFGEREKNEPSVDHTEANAEPNFNQG